MNAPPALLVDQLDAALPQTQCTRCGYPDCRAYAQAIADGEADINQCPPGGQEGVARLARIVSREPLPLNPANGLEGPRQLALIDEAWCIGCTLCLDACPVDAIVGGPKRMHTLIDELCTGCELCIPACPVDCISLHNVTAERTGWDAWTPAQADEAAQRYRFHRHRQARDAREHDERLAARAQALAARPPAAGNDPDARRSVVEAALARARARRPG